MTHIPLLFDFVVLLGAATIVILVCFRLKIPALVGFLITGILIGPSGLALISDVESVKVLAEFGVVALLFAIGLEFSLERLRQIRRMFLLGGSLQALLTTAATVGIALALGFGLSRAVFFGFLVTLSSTALVLKFFGDRNELESPHGKLIIGILLFQDFLVVPMIILTPVLAGVVEASPLTILVRFGGGILIIGVVFVVARNLMPLVLRQIVRTGIREILVVGALFIGLGMALLTESLEFSLALGAFIAGILISESEYSHQVVADILPFRDVFNSIFFISIGMLLSLEFVFDHLGLVLLFAGSLILLKLLLITGIVYLMRYPTRTAVTTGIGLAQIGEFSFILANVGLAVGLLTDGLFQAFLAGAVLTMMVTPFFIELSPRVTFLLQRILPQRAEAPDEPEKEGIRHHVVIIGYGLSGENVARVLKRTGIRYRIVELSGEAVERGRKAGEPIAFGDATRRELLEHVRIKDARVLLVAIADPVATARIVRFARQLSPEIYIIVRTRLVLEIEDLYAQGADSVIAEEFETSIEIFTRVLERYHIPRNVIQAQRRVLRAEGYEALREDEREVSSTMLDILAEGATDIYRVTDDAPVAGKTLAELNVRNLTGASILVVVRDDDTHAAPGGDFVIEPGDYVVLHGGHAAVERAFHYLAHGELSRSPVEE
ncbi:MAG: cation:proton antiporter [Acidobacteria bacterium]|nr:cation:proton antiporter [Acidobacteriota bacterium]